jgi:hypothetical protein
MVRVHAYSITIWESFVPSANAMGGFDVSSVERYKASLKNLIA